MKSQHLARFLTICGLLLLAFVLSLALQTNVQAQGGEDGRGMSMPDRLAPPPLPANPDQADLGGYDFYLYCMTCHGDRGQGLTEEWRSAWTPGDQNCWQSKCHAANHPPEGFQLPYFIPFVIGQGALARFATADELYQYVRTQMPWHWPGMYDDDIYWKLTAYLARANGLYTGGEVIGPENAAEIVLWPGRGAATPAPAATALGIGIAPTLGLGMLLGLLAGFVIVATAVFAMVRRQSRTS